MTTKVTKVTKATAPTSGIIMCVRCKAPGATCEHSPLRVYVTGKGGR